MLCIAFEKSFFSLFLEILFLLLMMMLLLSIQICMYYYHDYNEVDFYYYTLDV